MLSSNFRKSRNNLQSLRLKRRGNRTYCKFRKFHNSSIANSNVRKFKIMINDQLKQKYEGKTNYYENLDLLSKDKPIIEDSQRISLWDISQSPSPRVRKFSK